MHIRLHILYESQKHHSSFYTHSPSQVSLAIISYEPTPVIDDSY